MRFRRNSCRACGFKGAKKISLCRACRALIPSEYDLVAALRRQSAAHLAERESRVQQHAERVRAELAALLSPV